MSRSTPRGGFLDLLLVIAVCAAVVGRTPVGSLAWWATHRMAGSPLPLPSLVATFSDGLMTPPSVALGPLPDETLTEGQLPEPHRAALRAALADGIPEAVAARLVAEGQPVDIEGVLARVDAGDVSDPSRAVEALVLGDDVRARAIARARAAGADAPDDYTTYRIYLPNGVRFDADRVVGGTLAVARVLDLRWPVAPGFRVTSPFGTRTHPVLKTKRFHNGIDIGTPVGTPVHAPQGGVVAVAAENATSGRYVILDHGQGVRTAYCHLSTLDVNTGQSVEASDVIAHTGNTGRSTGPHLHYIVRIGGDPIDPLRFVTPE